MKDTMASTLRNLKQFAAAIALITAAGGAQAQLAVDANVTASGGLFHYNYTITNNNALDDLFDVAIHVNPTSNAVFNISTPTGFKSAFDPGLGLVDFVEDTNVFASSTPISGFSFDSAYGPASGAFDGNFLSVGNGQIYTVTGTTLTPTSPVPEPGSATFLISAGIATMLWFGRRPWHKRTLGNAEGESQIATV